MKYILLQVVELGEGNQFNYRDQLLEFAQLGYSDRSVKPDELEEIHPVIEKLTESREGSWLELENAEHKALLAKMDALGFRSSHKIICDFYLKVKYAASEKPAAQAAQV